MKIYLAALMTCVATVAWAGMADDVAELRAKVREAEVKLEAVKERIERAKARHGEADRDLRRAVRQMVQVGQYPPGFWLMRSVVMDTPAQAGLMPVAARMQAQKLVLAQAEAKQLTALYGEMNRQLLAVKEVEDAYHDADGRLMEAERAVLRRAGVQADALSADLQAALDASVTLADIKRAKVRVSAGPVQAGGLPVAGRIEKGFGSGQGAAKGGIVLRAAAGAGVRATQPGRVLFAGPFRQFGGLVIVKTVRGEDVLLGGFGTLAVKAGEDVEAGQGLGSVGDGGRIYWEVRRSGRLVNPL